MRVTLDTNVLISYLLSTGSPSPPSALVRAAQAGTFELVLPGEVLEEVRASALTKPFLASLIPPEAVEEFIGLISEGSRIVPLLNERPAKVSRDAGDDFLITHSVLEEIDYLVTGDKDLLVLGQVDQTQIVSPAAFVTILDSLAS